MHPTAFNLTGDELRAFVVDLAQTLHRATPDAIILKVCAWPSDDGWKPKIGECHSNAAFIVSRRPELAIVRGWLAKGSGCVFIAHSVVACDGELLDFTPADPVVTRDIRRFIRHPGSDESFERLRQTNPLIIHLEHDALGFPLDGGHGERGGIVQ